MGIFDKFKRKPKVFLDEWQAQNQPDETSDEEGNITPDNKSADDNETMPELADIVQNDQVEPGIPQNLSLGESKSIKRFVFLGVGIIAAGATVAGLITFASSESEPAAETQQQAKPADGNTRPKDFGKDKELIERERLLAAAEAEAAASAASEPAAASAVVPEAAPSAATMPASDSTTPVTGTSASSLSPKESLRNRRLSGDVLIEVGNKPLAASLNGNAEQSGNAPSGLTASNNEDGKAADNSSGSFAARLNPSTTASVSAQQRGDLTYLLTKGTNIRCGLDTRIITTQPGITRCVVSNDVYSANGKVVLIERGSKIIGEQTSAMLQGQARVFVLWNEVETPAGVKVSLRSPGSGALGEAGQSAHVNYHFWQRFGGAIMISLISDFGDSLNTNGNSGSNNNITYENTSDAAQQMATEALKNSINIPPTGTINQGALLNIMVARDVNFDKVYEFVETGL